MHLFGLNCDHDYYFELRGEEERDAQSISRCSTLRAVSDHRCEITGDRLLVRLKVGVAFCYEYNLQQ
jgi:hypothetical protein